MKSFEGEQNTVLQYETLELAKANIALNNFFRPRALFPLSQSLPENPLKDDRQESYRLLGGEDYSSPDFGKTNKTDFLVADDPNVGWKIHLNVGPSSRVDVHRYLYNNRYTFKFLNGGDISLGKIFTVYVGSHKKIDELARVISNDLFGKLCKPRAFGDIEFYSGVVARFVSEGGLDSRRGKNDRFGKNFIFSGMQALAADNDALLDLNKKYRDNYEDPEYIQAINKIRPEVELRSYALLRELYGDYFYPEQK